ncbi:MAG: DUF1398 domain-containing protein [Thaumarchaeota archaeon]|nr:DUF1398 domain-containing protein [Nitrososphaerota archaeon]
MRLCSENPPGGRVVETREIEECTRLNFEGKIGFGENVKRMLAAGAVWYSVDLVQLMKVSYGEGDAYAESIRLTNPGKASGKFSERAVVEAIAATQRKEIDYREFLRRLVSAGCVYYVIFMKGRRMVYVGGLGENHEEEFPEQLVRYLED